MLLLASFAVSSLALGAIGYVASVRWARFPQLVLPALLGLLAAHAALKARPDWEWACFPFASYAYVQGFWLYPLATLFFGVAAGRLPVRWNRVVVLLAGSAALAHGVARHSWIAWPEVHGELVFADAQHHLRQSTAYTCGPAACVAALSRCGVRVTEREMASLCLTRSCGTSLFDLYRGVVLSLEGKPYRVSIRMVTADHVMERRLLVVASNRGGGHAICVEGNATDAVVHDPLQAAGQTWSRQRLQQDFLPPAIVIERSDRDHSEPAAPR